MLPEQPSVEDQILSYAAQIRAQLGQQPAPTPLMEMAENYFRERTDAATLKQALLSMAGQIAERRQASQEAAMAAPEQPTMPSEQIVPLSTTLPRPGAANENDQTCALPGCSHPESVPGNIIASVADESKVTMLLGEAD